MLPAGLARRNAKNRVREHGEVGDHQIGLGRRTTEARGVVCGPHADAVRPDHVEALREVRLMQLRRAKGDDTIAGRLFGRKKK